jgi:hypothetical protein
VVWNYSLLKDHRSGRKQTGSPDHGFLKDDGIHPNQRMVADFAALKDRTVTHRDLGAYHGRTPVANVDHDPILNRTPATNDDGMIGIIAPEDCPKPDGRTTLDPHITDQHGVGRDKGVFSDLGLLSTKGDQEGHERFLRKG